MKIREGFVSNSSSSSFVVSFPKEPKSVEDVKNVLFDEDQKIYANPYDEGGWPVETAAETVWKGICDQKKNDIPVIMEELTECSKYDDPEAPYYKDFEHIENLDERYKAEEIASQNFANKKIKEFINIRKNKLKKLNNEEDYIDNAVYIFEYSDNKGSYGCSLEHGDLFNKLKHIRISKH